MNRRIWILFVLSFFALWSAAWLLHTFLVQLVHLWSSGQIGRDTIYWLLMKILVWVVWPMIFFRGRIQQQKHFLGLAKAYVKRGIRWGLVAAVIWASLSLLAMPLFGQHVAWPNVWWIAGYAAVVTPFFEEILFRGYVLTGLQSTGVDGRPANVITSLLFVLIHFLGWGFQGVFLHNIHSTIWISIFMLSMVLGFIRIHSKSLWSSVILHTVNNALAAFL